MNAATLPSRPVHARRDQDARGARIPRDAARQEATRRRRAIALGLCGAFLGVYVLGVSWFANSLTDDMARSFQLAPAVQDVEHR